MGRTTIITDGFDDAAAPPIAESVLHDKAVTVILDTVRNHLETEVALLCRHVDKGQLELTHISAESGTDVQVGTRQQCEGSYCWQAFKENIPALIRDTAEIQLAQKLASMGNLPTGCHVHAPLLLADGTLWGSLCAFSRTARPDLNPRDYKILQSFAGMAAERIEQCLAEEEASSQMRKRVEAMLDGHAVTMFQQPIHDLATLKAAGVECLARFPDLNKRGPGAWFEDAAQVGLGAALELTAVRCALETVGQVPEGIYAAINASPATILSGKLRQVLEESGADNLVLEITDHHLVEDFEALEREVQALKPFCRIAIDDAGTGLSGLAGIERLQPDMLKLNMQLTRDCHRDPARQAITAAMVSFAADIGCKTVAEGIETENECTAMRELGVDYGQGYLFARPLPVIAAQQHLLGITT